MPSLVCFPCLPLFVCDAWTIAKLNSGPSTKATGGQGINYYVLKVAGPAFYPSIRSSTQAIFDANAPTKWSHALLPSSSNKGNRKNPQNYRLVCLIQTLQKLAVAVFNDLPTFVC